VFLDSESILVFNEESGEAGGDDVSPDASEVVEYSLTSVIVLIEVVVGAEERNLSTTLDNFCVKGGEDEGALVMFSFSLSLFTNDCTFMATK
jgi:hypothetical protein